MHLDSILELKGITKTFPGVKALSNVSFDVRRGEVHAICGENGAGKSTLIKVMTGFHRPDSGECFVNGVPTVFQNTSDAINAGIACIYQELSIVPLVDVAHNLFLGNLPKKKNGLLDLKKLYADSQEILDRIDLKVSPKALAGDLSIAQQQMVEIGRALTRNAQLIIMDEPTSSLTDKEVSVLFSLIEKLRKEQVSIVYISHKLREVLQLSDRITVLCDGKLIKTVQTSETDQRSLVSYMIGRNLDDLYNKTPAKLGEPLLRVEGLTKKGVFSDVSFEVRKGEVLGFFGLVGAGRSEVMRAIFGIDKYDSGKIIIDGQEVQIRSSSQAIGHRLALVPENRKQEGLALSMSIKDNITLVKLRGINWKGIIDKKKQRALTNEYIEKLRVKTPTALQLVGNLSGGNQQKVVIAKWLMVQPRILILDEPTRGIDVGSKAEIYGLISKLANEGVAVIVVSSELPEILGICDDVITMFEGRLVERLHVPETNSAEILHSALGGISLD